MPLRVATAFTAIALLSAAAAGVKNHTSQPGSHFMPDERRAADARVTNPPPISAPQPEAIAADMENNTDRPGADVMRFTLPRGTGPESCRSACSPGGRCKAWTYVRPGVQGPEAVCYLKDAVAAARANACCVSGLVDPPRRPRPEVVAREPTSVQLPQDEIEPGMENDTDRPGRDIASFTTDLPTYSTPIQGAPPGGFDFGGIQASRLSSGQAGCSTACWDHRECVAWTYVRRGVQGRDAVCYLKGPGTSKVSNPCCISGLREPPPAPDPSVHLNHSRPKKP